MTHAQTRNLMLKVGQQISEECASSKKDLSTYSTNIDTTSASECMSEVLTKLLSVISPKCIN